jgi:PPOX class probable F420-dependent enzyme
VVELSGKIREALEEPNFWHLATVNPDGSPQATTMWVDVRDGHILLNSALGRKKPRNLERDPRIALSFFRPDRPYNSIAIQGRVVDSYVGEEAEADIDRLAKKYLGEDVYPWRKPGERRITYLVEPTHVYHQDA